MSEIKDRIKENIPPTLSQQNFAAQVGVSLSTLKSWISGRAQPTFEYIAPLANALNKSVDWLVTGEDAKDINITTLNVYDAELSAGHGSYIESNNIIGQYALPDTFFETYSLSKNNALGVFVRGDSMEPKFYNGDVAVIDRSSRLFECDGIYAFYYEGNCFIKHLQLIGKNLYAISSNKAYEKWIIDMPSDFKIIGRVKAAICRV